MHRVSDDMQCTGNGRCLIEPYITCYGDCRGIGCDGRHKDTERFCLNCIVKNWKRKRATEEEKDDDNNTSRDFKRIRTKENDESSDFKRTLTKENDESSDEDTQVLDEEEEVKVEDTDDGLSDEQREGLRLAEQRKNLFITGGGGVGKTFLIEKIVATLEAKNLSVHVTATTGGAAWRIGGSTFHRYLGCGLAEEELSQLLEMLKKNRAKREEIKKTDVLVIDEVSMMDAKLFTKFDAIAKELRCSPRPFGGIQLILVGDFLQLPPVEKNQQQSQSRYIFLTNVWKKADFQIVGLAKNFRQCNDHTFLALLNNARINALTRDDEALLRSRLCASADIDRSDVTRIFSQKIDVQNRNTAQLNAIKGRKRIYTGHFVDHRAYGNTANTANNTFFKSIPVEDRLELKMGALVLLCCNLDVDAGLFNGTPGRVVGFSAPQANTFKAAKKRNPLPFAFKKEVKTTPIAEDDEIGEDDPDEGADIVCTDMDYLRLPIVAFSNGEKLTIEPHTWEIRDKKGLVSSYTNLPLILRYAITTHKAQGQTLPSAMIDMKSFATGQCYTALSRVCRLSDLYLIKFDRQGLMADAVVLNFYRSHGLL